MALEYGGTNSLHVSLLGGFSASINGEPLNIRLERARALLAYMALGHENFAKDTAYVLLWDLEPETTDALLRNRLKQVVHSLSTTLADAGWFGFVSKRGKMELERSTVGIDAIQIIDDINDGICDPRLLEGRDIFDSLLSGYDGISQDFSLWVSSKRRALADEAIDALEVQLAGPELVASKALKFATALLSLDPTHDRACRASMMAHAKLGRVGRALEVYDDFCAYLDAEYDGQMPSDETRDLAAELKSGNLPAGSDEPALPAPAADKPQRLIIHVLPIEGIDENFARGHLLQGFRQMLVGALVRFREWTVLDAGSPQAGPNADGDEVYEMSFTAIPMGDAVEMIVNFKRSDTSQVVWGETFDALDADWPLVQKKLTHQMAMALNLHVSAERMSRIYDGDEFDLPTIDAWLYGQNLLLSYDGADWDRAVTLFENILKKHPKFSRARSSLSQLENGRHLYFPGVMRDEWRHQKAYDHAVKAVEADGFDSRALLSLGWARLMLHQADGAEMAIAHALERNPNDPWTTISVALGYAFMGRKDEAQKLAERAFELGAVPSPAHWVYQATVQFLRGDYAACIHACDQVVPNVSFFDLEAWRASALAHLGQFDDARVALDSFLQTIRCQWYDKDQTPTDRQIAEWFLQCFPIQLEEDLGRLREGLILAGFTAARGLP